MDQVLNKRGVLRMLVVVCMVVASLAPASHADGQELVTNGSFESPLVGAADPEPLFGEGAPGSTNTGWSAWGQADVGGWSAIDGSNIELWDQGSVYNGAQFAELHAHPAGNGGLKQTLDTTNGVRYRLSFYYRERSDSGSDNTFTAKVKDGATELLNSGVLTGGSGWVRYEATFVAGVNDPELRFEISNASNTFGGFIDAVSVVAVPPDYEKQRLQLLVGDVDADNPQEVQGNRAKGEKSGHQLLPDTFVKVQAIVPDGLTNATVTFNFAGLPEGVFVYEDDMTTDITADGEASWDIEDANNDKVFYIKAEGACNTTNLDLYCTHDGAGGAKNEADVTGSSPVETVGVCDDNVKVYAGSCGCTDCVGSSEGDAGCLQFQINLGLVGFGEDGGYLLLLAQRPTDGLASPELLQLFLNDRMSVSGGFKADDNKLEVTSSDYAWGEAKLTVHSAYKYDIKFYERESLTLEGDPYRTVTVENTNGASSNDELYITEEIDLENSTTKTRFWHFEWDPVSGSDGSWILTEGEAGAGAGLTGDTKLRITERAEAWVGDVVTETITIKDGSGTVASKTEEVYEAFEWGREMTSRTRDPETTDADKQLKETWTYYTDAAADGDNYGRMESYLSETGYWERYEYDAAGNTSKTMRQLNDEPLALGVAFATEAADNIVEEYTETVYEDTDELFEGTADEEEVLVERTVIKVEGTIERTQYMIYRREKSDVTGCTEEWSVRCETKDPENGTTLKAVIENLLDGSVPTGYLITKTWRWEAAGTGIGDNETYDVRGMLSPDGQATRYERSDAIEFGVGGASQKRTTTVRRGYFGASDVEDVIEGTADITYGTKTTSVTDARGNAISTKTERISEDDNSGNWFIVAYTATTDDDEFGRPTETSYFFGLDAAEEVKDGTGTATYTTGLVYGCCGGGVEEIRTGRNGVQNATFEDVLGRTGYTRRAIGTSAKIYSVNEYDGAGRVIKSGLSTDTDLADAADLVSQRVYDKAGRMTTSEDEEDRQTYMTYRRVTTTGGTYAGTGVFYWETRRYGHDKDFPVSVTWADSHGRVVRSFVGSCTAFDGGGGVPDGEETLTEHSRSVTVYDWDDRPTETRVYFDLDAVDGEGTSYLITNQTTYDVLGRAELRTDAADNVTKTIYEDGTGRAIKTQVGITGGTLYTVSRVFYKQFEGGDDADDPTGDERPWVTRAYAVKPNLTTAPTENATMSSYVYAETDEDWSTATHSTTYHYLTTGSKQWSKPQYGPWSYSESDEQGRTIGSYTTKNGSTTFKLTKTGTSYYPDNTTLAGSEGRVQYVDRFPVDHGGFGTVGTSKIRTTYHYDDAGRQIKTETTGRGYSKTAFDTYGRTARTVFASSEGSDTDAFDTTSDAVDFTDDIILTESVPTYDDSGLVTGVVTYERTHDAPNTTTGLLSDAGVSAAHRRVAYSHTWYDANGRQTHTASLGTDSSYTYVAITPIEPNTLDTRLVSKVEYDDAGRVEVTTDNLGRKTKRFFDDMSRVTHVIENWDGTLSTPDTPGNRTANPDRNRVTKTIYDNSATGGGARIELVAIDPDLDGIYTDNQSTLYIHSGEVDVVDRGYIPVNGRPIATAMPDGDDRPTVVAEIKNGTVYEALEVLGDFTYVEYYANGAVYRNTDQRGVRLESVYTDEGWLDYVKVTEATGDTWDSTGDLRIAYTYGDAGEVETITTYDVATGGDANRTSKITYTYDNFYNRTTEKQDHDPTAGSGAGVGKTITWTFDATTASDVFTKAYRLDKIKYPSLRELQLLYNGHNGIDDAIGRPNVIEEEASGDDIVAYTYLGGGRMVRKDYLGPDVRLDMADESGDGTDPDANDPYNFSLDAFGRPIRYQWETYTPGSPDAGDEDLLNIKHAYDRNSNRTYDKRTVYNAHSKVFRRDDLDRITGRDEGIITITSGVGTIGNHWMRDGRDFDYDQLGNQKSVDVQSASTTFTDRYGVTTNASNEIDKLRQDPDAGPQPHVVYFSTSGEEDIFTTQVRSDGTTDNSSNVDVSGGRLRIQAATVGDPAFVLMAPELGAVPAQWSLRIEGTLPTTDTLVGYLFGYQDKDNYWVYGKNMNSTGSTSGDRILRKVVAGTVTDTVVSNGTVAGSTDYTTYGWNLHKTVDRAMSNGELDAFPAGRVGFYTESADAEFDYLRHAPTGPDFKLNAAWQSTGTGKLVDYGSGDYKIWLSNNWSRQVQPVLLRHVRSSKFEAVFSVVRYGPSSEADLGFVFNYEGPGDFDYVLLDHAASTPDAPYGYEFDDGGARTVVSESSRSAAPTVASSSTKLWYKVTSDGSSLKVYVSTAGSPSADSITTLVYDSGSSAFDMVPGQLGFIAQGSVAYIDDVSVRTSSDAATIGTSSTFEQEELIDETFATSGGNTEADFVYDAAGNRIHDGFRGFSYDAFNRLVEVKIDPDHTASADAGSVLATYQYDGQNRRIFEVSYTSDGMDTSLHQYYAGWSLIETRDDYSGGGGQRLVTQHVWDNLAGHYIDSLVQIGHNLNTNEDVDRAFYALQDQQFNVMMLIDEDADIVERYEYGLYGERQVYRRSAFDPGKAMTLDLDDDYDHDDADESIALSNYLETGQTYLDGDFDGDGDVDDADYGIMFARTNIVGSGNTLDTKALTQTTRSSVIENTGVPLCSIGFTGQRFNDATGLWDFRNRSYDSETGKFMTVDLKLYIDGMNARVGHFVLALVTDASGLEVVNFDIPSITIMNGADGTSHVKSAKGSLNIEFDSTAAKISVSDFLLLEENYLSNIRRYQTPTRIADAGNRIIVPSAFRLGDIAEVDNRFGDVLGGRIEIAFRIQWRWESCTGEQKRALGNKEKGKTCRRPAFRIDVRHRFAFDLEITGQVRRLQRPRGDDGGDGGGTQLRPGDLELVNQNRDPDAPPETYQYRGHDTVIVGIWHGDCRAITADVLREAGVKGRTWQDFDPNVEDYVNVVLSNDGASIAEDDIIKLEASR